MQQGSPLIISLLRAFLPAALLLLIGMTQLPGASVTFQFQGVMDANGTDSDFTADLEFSGSYTFDSSAAGFSPLQEGSINRIYHFAIASWEVTFPSTGYVFEGAIGAISVGNNTAFGDRYIATLSGVISSGAPLPSGRRVNFIQFDLQSRFHSGRDFLRDNSIQVDGLDLSLVELIGGRVSMVVDAQPRLTLTQLTRVRWHQVSKSTASDAGAADHFGVSVAISGDTKVVGAPTDDDAGDASGSAYVFERDQGGMDNWGQIKKLVPLDAVAQAQFGTSVAISADTVVVGASRDDDLGNDSGSAYLFERNQGGIDNWGQVKKLIPLDAAANARFGSSVSISGDSVVVGASAVVPVGGASGSAYVFESNQGGTDNWGQTSKLNASDAAGRDGFGNSVGISGDTVVVGVLFDDDGGADSGSAYFFGRNQGGGNSWGQVDKLTASDAAPGDNFGRSVGINGNIVVVGADNDGAGSVYVFQPSPGAADDWVQVNKLTASDSDPNDRFGFSVAIDGQSVAVGAVLDDDAGNSSGSAYVFEPNQGGADSWVQVNKLTASDAAAEDQFGGSVAISGDTVVVSAVLDDDNEVDSGSSYVFVEVESVSPSSTSSWIFQGTAQGGEVSTSINDCFVSLTTVPGQSAFSIAADFAALLDASDCLKTQGITAQAVRSEVTITGASISVIDFAITDPGLQHATPTSPEFTTVDFPTAVVGGGSSTEITLVQGATAALETLVRVLFLSQAGSVDGIRSLVLAPNSTASVTFDGDNLLQVGHIETRVGSGVVATEVIRLSTGPESVSLIGVGPSLSCKRPVVGLKRNLEFNTGVALSNTRGETATCSWSIHSGPESTLIATGSIALPPSGQTQSFPLNDLPIAPLPAPFEGNIQYECDVPVHAFSLLQERDGGLVSNATSCFDGQP